MTDALSRAITTLRGYGGRLMIVVQSLANLTDVYGRDGAANILANCRMQLFMAPADAETPEYISRAVGDFTRKARSRSWQSSEMMSSNVQERAEGARLVRPEELRRLGEATVIALAQNQDPIKTHKVVYYADKGLKDLFEAQSGGLPVAPVLEWEGGRGRTAVRPPASAPKTTDLNGGVREGPAERPATLGMDGRRTASGRSLEDGLDQVVDFEPSDSDDLDQHLAKHQSVQTAIERARAALDDEPHEDDRGHE